MGNEKMAVKVKAWNETAAPRAVRVKVQDGAAPVSLAGREGRTVAFTGAFAGVGGQPGDYVARFVDVEMGGAGVGEKNVNVAHVARFRGLSLGGYVRGVFTLDADGDVIAVGRVRPIHG